MWDNDYDDEGEDEGGGGGAAAAASAAARSKPTAMAGVAPFFSVPMWDNEYETEDEEADGETDDEDVTPRETAAPAWADGSDDEVEDDGVGEEATPFAGGGGFAASEVRRPSSLPPRALAPRAGGGRDSEVGRWLRARNARAAAAAASHGGRKQQQERPAAPAAAPQPGASGGARGLREGFGGDVSGAGDEDEEGEAKEVDYGLDASQLEELERRAREAGADDGDDDDDGVAYGKLDLGEGGGAVEDALEQSEESFGTFSPRRLSTYTIGEVGTELYRRFFTYSGGLVSPWHDIPLYASIGNDEVWMVTEIPKRTKAKQGILISEMMNPMAQKLESGKPQEYKESMQWNYGFLPQTWEDPAEEQPGLHFKGGNGPVDAIEIGARQHSRGDVTKVKVLGAFLVVDRGEFDWKIVVVDVNDPLASKLKLVPHLHFWDKAVPKDLRAWFQQNEATNGRVAELTEVSNALQIIEKTHEAWRRLRSGEVRSRWAWVGDVAEKPTRQRSRSGQVEYTGKPRSRLVPQGYTPDDIGSKHLADAQRDLRKPQNRGHRPLGGDEDLRNTRSIASSIASRAGVSAFA